MKEILTRAISGSLYVVILLGSIFFSSYAFLILLLFFGIVCLLEFTKITQVTSIFPIVLFLGLMLGMTFLKFSDGFQVLLLSLTLMINIVLLYDLFSKETSRSFITNRMYLFHIISGFLFLYYLSFYNDLYTPQLIAGLFILIWANDVFAYLVGKSIGRHKLFERISPKKTIEGFLGGIIITCVLSFFIHKYILIFAPIHWFAIALIVCLFGTIGDLIQSKVKRKTGVKDSGSIMPGHGGLYDRLDSILYASPFVYAYLMIIPYVS